MGFSLGDLWNAATAPFVAASNVVSDLAHGRITSAINNSIGTLATFNPLQQVDTLSGGLLKDKVGNVPLLGQTTQKFLASGEKLASGNGNFNDVTQYGVSSAVLAGAAVGGGELYGAGVSATTGLLGATTLDKVAKGDLSGALASGSQLASGVDLGIGLPGGVTDAYNTISPYLGSSGGAATSLASRSIGGAPSADALGKGTTSNQMLPILLIGGATIGAYFMLRKK
jgi:hypothetical protein